MSVIEKIKKYGEDNLSYGSDWGDGNPHNEGLQDGLKVAIEFIQEDPAHTAREKARRVAERINEMDSLQVRPDEIIFWSWGEWCWGDDYDVFTEAEMPDLTDLTPTPEEIATGCCCYVVPEKGETDEK